MAEEQKYGEPSAKEIKEAKKAKLEAEKAYVEALRASIERRELGNALRAYQKAPAGFKDPLLRNKVIATLEEKKKKLNKAKGKTNTTTAKKKAINNVISTLNSKPSEGSLEKLLKSKVWEKTLVTLKAKNNMMKAATAKFGPNYAKSMALVLPKRKLTEGKNYFAAANAKHTLESKKRGANNARAGIIAMLKAEDPNTNWAKHIKAKGHAAYANQTKINRIVELARARKRLSANKRTKVNRQSNKRSRWANNFRARFPNNFNMKNITSRNLASKKLSPEVKALIERRILKRKGVSTKEQKLNHIAGLLGLERSCIKITAKCLEKYEPRA